MEDFSCIRYSLFTILPTMSRSSVMDGIVMRTIDIGEADRLCILFTKEAGLIAARAKAVRKPGSRMGGTLLPMRRVQVEMVQTDSNAIITGARTIGEMPNDANDSSLFLFLRFGQAAEMVLMLMEEGEPMPKIHDLLCQFLQIAGTEEDPLPAFQLRLLFLLGLLPYQQDDRRYAKLSREGQLCVAAFANNAPLRAFMDLPLRTEEIDRFRTLLIQDSLNRPMKSAGLHMTQY